MYLPEHGAPPPDIGGKAHGLLRIVAAGLATAPWFAVRTDAQGRQSALVREIEAALHVVDPKGSGGFAVRSSAVEEDGATASFAGLFQTTLNVREAAAITDAVESCWASAASANALAYSAAHGRRPGGMAVVVQAMVSAEASGVAFSRPPDSERDEVVVVACRGLGSPLVAGEVDGDEYRVRVDGGVSVVRWGGQEWRAESAPQGGLLRRAVPEHLRDARILTDAQAREVAEAARRLDSCAGAPQDVEWTLADDGRLIVLQTRPITARTAPSAAETVRLWDNANIVESFPGVTLPLTFSVAREAYTEVYRLAFLAMGVSRHAVEAQADTFDQMIGLVQGRVYYNVGSWHRVLALLPAFRHGQRSLERMMGAERPGGRPGEGAAPVPPMARLIESIGMSACLLWKLAIFERRADAFRRAAATLRAQAEAIDFAALSTDALLDYYDRTRRRAVAAWRAPILNDLFLMAFHGALWSASERWLGPPGAPLVQQQLRSGELPGTRAAAALAAIADRLGRDPEWRAAVEAALAGTPLALLRADTALAGLWRELDAYLQRWGDRMPGELQLERQTYRDDPLPLLQVLREMSGAQSGVSSPAEDREARSEGLLRRLQVGGDDSERCPHQASPTAVGEAKFRGGLVRSLARRMAFRFLLGRTRYHLRWREEMRLARGQVFAIARRVFVALGRALANQGVLVHHEDIHYLDVAEVRSLLRGTAATGDVQAVVAARRAAYDGYRAGGAPPSRFETQGPVAAYQRVSRPPAGENDRADGRLCLQGTGVSPGRAEGLAVLAQDPWSTSVPRGSILVARTTDPGWMPLFLAAAGLLVERGSLLSHSAILARELGLPAIVGIPDMLERLATGDRVEIDGSTGEVWVSRAPSTEG